jgi:hypothetical protein
MGGCRETVQVREGLGMSGGDRGAEQRNSGKQGQTRFHGFFATTTSLFPQSTIRTGFPRRKRKQRNHNNIRYSDNEEHP